MSDMVNFPVSYCCIRLYYILKQGLAHSPAKAGLQIIIEELRSQRTLFEGLHNGWSIASLSE